MSMPIDPEDPQHAVRVDWQWDKDFKELTTFDFNELDNYIIRPAGDGPQAWCQVCAQPVTKMTNKLRGMLEEVMEHHRLTHAVPK